MISVFLLQCHTGILGGGHYVAFAKNPNRKWYCYNDSSCKVSLHFLTEKVSVMVEVRLSLKFVAETRRIKCLS